jgi:hypothetical protein
LQTAWNNMKYGVYDPVTDAVWIGYGSQLYRFDCSTTTFHTFGFGGQFSPGARLGGVPTGTYAIDPGRRKIWITDPGLGGARYTHGRIFTVEISNPDAPTLSKLCDLPASWRDISPAWNQTWFMRQCYDTQLVYMASRGLLFLWGPSERTPDSILIDVNTGKIYDGPDLPRNAAGTKDCVLRMAQYDAPRDRIICGWSQNKPGEWGAMQDVYWIYTPKDTAGSMQTRQMGLATPAAPYLARSRAM